MGEALAFFAAHDMTLSDGAYISPPEIQVQSTAVVFTPIIHTINV